MVSKRAYGLRKAKTKTTLVGCELGTVKKTVIGTALLVAAALPFSLSQVALAEEMPDPTPIAQVEEEGARTEEVPVQSGENTLDFTIDSTTSIQAEPRNILVIRDDSGSFRNL